MKKLTKLDRSQKAHCMLDQKYSHLFRTTGRPIYKHKTAYHADVFLNQQVEHRILTSAEKKEIWNRK